MTGENSFIRLSPDGGKTLSDRFSHWRVLWCPDGAGHALFVDSTLLGGQTRIYSDNPAVARWLQKNIETILYQKFADTNLPIVQAQFTRAGSPPNPATETIVGGGDRIVMTWSDTITPFILNAPPTTVSVAGFGGDPARVNCACTIGRFVSANFWYRIVSMFFCSQRATAGLSE
jgi:hypothetical protein